MNCQNTKPLNVAILSMEPSTLYCVDIAIASQSKQYNDD